MKLNESLKKIDDDVCITVGGDWNCTTDFTINRNEEPHNQSSLVLSKIMNIN